MLNLSRSTPIRILVPLSLAAVSLFAPGTRAVSPLAPGIAAATPSAPGDLAPPVVPAPASAQTHEGILLQFTVSASAPDGDPILFLGIAGGSPGICLACFVPDPGNMSGTFSWTPGYQDAGSYSVTFEAVTATATATALTTIQVLDTDRPPEVTAPVSVHIPLFVEGTFTVSATDPDGDAIQSLTAAPLPPGATFTTSADNTAGTFTWTPGFSQEGTWLITFTASNALPGTAQTTIEAGGSDRPPVVTAPATAQTDEGVALVFDVTASDPEGGPLVLTAFALPPGATFTDHGDNTGTFAWTPNFSQAGSYGVTFRAVDPLGIAGQALTAISVNDENQAPVAEAGGPYLGLLTIPVTLYGDRSYDPDGDPLTYAWDFGDGGTGTGAIVQHLYFACGDYAATLTVTDPHGLSGTDVAYARLCWECFGRIYTVGSNKIIRLGSSRPGWSVQFEPGCFTIEDIVLSSFRMYYEGTGRVGPIYAIPDKAVISGDRDRNGVPDLAVTFATDDLRTLFSALPDGQNVVWVSVEAMRPTGTR